MRPATQRRATSRQAKEDRRETILDTAADLFEHIGFRDSSMALLAERAGVAKGTVYLYFPTKEAVFLGLYRREVETWTRSVESGLEQLANDDHQRLAGLLVDAVVARRNLPALASLLHTVLERNLPFDALLAFKQEILVANRRLGAGLEDRLAFLQPGDGLRLLQRFHALVIGTWQAATPAPIARKVLDLPDMVDLRMDFSEELENLLLLLLEGWYRAEGA